MLSKEGYGIITVLFFFVGLFLSIGIVNNNILMYILAGFTFVLFSFTIYFFREPARQVPQGPNIIVAPSDGLVIGIHEIEESEFIQGTTIRISIFLSLFDVHVNYVPIAGTVDFVKYERGKFFRANTDNALKKNAHTKIGLTTAFGKIVFKQSVGMIARRIVCNLRYGNKVTTGQKFGFIKFGSRLDVYLPSWAQVQVNVGDRLKGSETQIGVAREN
jgi:phosphatidylserine decarboxylase